MNPDEISNQPDPAPVATTRRQFLQRTAGAVAAAAVFSELPSPAQALNSTESSHTNLPTINLGTHPITRLVIGGNPIYGYSHFNRILSQYQTAWHTPERVVELLLHAEASGINTWQSSYAERTLADLERYRSAGGKMNWLCLGLYYLTRPRDEFQKLLGGELPAGEIYLASDPARMFKVIKGTTKPCLAYKVLAAGRKIDNAAQVRQCFETAFNNMKPADAVIVGMYQQLSDQVGENAGIVRDICASRASR